MNDETLPPMQSNVPWPAPVEYFYQYDGCWLMRSLLDNVNWERAPCHQLEPDIVVPPVYDYEIKYPLRARLDTIPCVQTEHHYQEDKPKTKEDPK